MPETSQSGDALLREAIGQAQAGKFPDAMATLTRAPAAEPQHAGLNAMMGTLLHASGRAPESVAYLERAHAGAPKNAQVAYQLGAVLSVLGRGGRAVELMRLAVELEPSWVQAINGLASTLYGLGDYDGADAMYRRSLAAKPGQAEAMCGLAGLLIVGGKPAEAVPLFREAARLHPSNIEVLGKLVSALNYAEDATPEESIAAHRAWGAAVGVGRPLEFKGTRAPERKLKVGFLSPDLYDHSCAYFLRPILKHRDRSAFDAICYSTSAQSDWMTAQLRGLADGWREASGWPGPKLVDAIRADGVDVLLELAGHTALGPLAALKDRAAPVQANYLGYPNTTGLATMDWRVVDGATDVGGAEAWHSEKLARLEGCFLCYSAPDRAPGISARASAGTADPWHQGSSITFGSFNSIRKLSPTVIRMWSAVLREVEGSRLLLKTRGLGTVYARRNLQLQFEEQGVAGERVEFHDMVPEKSDHLSYYGRVDVGLDTFPYNGTTTTCEAMWMGVPVVSLCGRVHASRVGASLMRAAGMPELVATNESEFVAIAVGLAKDRARLASMRGSMRERLSGSALMDGPRHARGFFEAVRGMWREWCKGGGGTAS